MSMGVCSKCHTFGEPINHNGRGLRCANCWAAWAPETVETAPAVPTPSLDGVPVATPTPAPVSAPQSKPATGGKKKRK